MIDKVPLSRARRKYQVPRCLVIWIPGELLSTRQESFAQGRDSSGTHAAGAGQRSEGKQWLGLGFTSRGMDSSLRESHTVLQPNSGTSQ